MDLHLTPEQEAHLLQVAQHEGKDPEQIVIDATLRLLEEDTRTREILRERVREADRGMFLDEEDMNARVQSMLRS